MAGYWLRGPGQQPPRKGRPAVLAWKARSDQGVFSTSGV